MQTFLWEGMEMLCRAEYNGVDREKGNDVSRYEAQDIERKREKEECWEKKNRKEGGKGLWMRMKGSRRG